MASPSHINDEDEDDLDHVTTISVDVHTMDSLRGPVKVSPVSSAGLDCSCGESCACSSYDSEEDRPNDDNDFSTNSIACQTEQPSTSAAVVVVASNAVDKKSSTKTLSPNACRASKKLRSNHSSQSPGTQGKGCDLKCFFIELTHSNAAISLNWVIQILPCVKYLFDSFGASQAVY